MSKTNNLIAAVVMTLTGVGVQAQQAVVPGRSVGTITLGMPRTEVWKHLGKPTESDTFSFAHQRYVEDYWQSRQGVLNAVVSRGDRIIQTQRDLGPHWETFSSIRKCHPHLEATLYDHGGDVGSDLILDDVQQGEAWKIYIWHEEFTYSRNGATRVSYNDARANWVIIHKCGQPALPNPGSKPIKDALLLHNLRAWFAASAQVHTGKN